jgi:hypothetical protein
MEPFSRFPAALRARIGFVLTDVDDTLTDGPRLPAAAYLAIERLQGAGITVIPVTAAPAGVRSDVPDVAGRRGHRGEWRTVFPP